MNQNGEKIVEFHGWCEKCKHFEIPETDEPCCECLEETVNMYSVRPVRWEEEK